MTLLPPVIRFASQPVSVQRFSSFKLPRLIEIGTIEPPRGTDDPYPSGQVFRHKVLNYRGVILFPWITKVYDRDKEKEKHRFSSFLTAKKVYSCSPNIQYYYQTLIDERDWKDVKLQVDSVVYLGVPDCFNQVCRESFKGFDYVSHDDIVPYTSSEPIAVHHQMFDMFLSRRVKDSNVCYIPKDVLRFWREYHVNNLRFSNVFRETTKNIRVSVIPFFLYPRQQQEENAYWWQFCVRMETFSKEPCIVKEREWKIKSTSGVVETKKARGVLLREPVLSERQRAFQFSNSVKLVEPSGMLWGSFKMEKESGAFFRVYVPPCYLKSEPVDDVDPELPNYSK